MRAEHLYVHVPFCARRCVYCDFSIAVRSKIPSSEFIAGIDREWQLRHEHSEFRLETLYFGGGTPSKLDVGGVGRLLDIVRRRAEIQPNAEVTLEANPEDVTRASARAWRAAGINRVSLGVQSFDDAVLAWMHRTHDAVTALRAVQVLREATFDNISIDLIFAAPSQLERSWERDVATAAELDIPHVSVYGLTIEPKTPLGRWVARRDVEEAPEDRFEREYLIAHEALTGAGLQHYEVSNYALAGRHSRHNWSYWRRQPYGGLGPSAHEFDGGVRRWNIDAFVEWESRIARGCSPSAGSEVLTREQELAEQVYLNLRTVTGTSLSSEERGHVAPWIEAGWATIDSDSMLRLTAIGWLRLDALASDLTLFRSRY